MINFCFRIKNNRAEHTKLEINVYEASAGSQIVGEFGIRYVSGYYGGIRGTEKEYLCINPTVHKENAIAELHYQGDGLVKIPLLLLMSMGNRVRPPYPVPIISGIFLNAGARAQAWPASKTPRSLSRITTILRGLSRNSSFTRLRAAVCRHS